MRCPPASPAAVAAAVRHAAGVAAEAGGVCWGVVKVQGNAAISVGRNICVSGAAQGVAAMHGKPVGMRLLEGPAKAQPMSLEVARINAQCDGRKALPPARTIIWVREMGR